MTGHQEKITADALRPKRSEQFVSRLKSMIPWTSCFSFNVSYCRTNKIMTCRPMSFIAAIKRVRWAMTWR